MTTCACGSETLHPATPDQKALQLGGGAEGRSHAKRPEGQSLARLGTGLYCWSGLREDPLLLLTAWRRALPPESAFAGATAAWLLGLDMSPIDPVEIVVPAGSGVQSRTGLNVRHCEISMGEIVSVSAARNPARRTAGPD